MPADQRENKINDLASRSGFNRDPFLREFGLQLDMRMTEARGRVLPPPAIQYNNEGRGARGGGVVQPRDGAWEMNGQILYKAAACRSYAMIGMVNTREQGALQYVHILHTVRLYTRLSCRRTYVRF